jgi:hypothetical protein
MKNVSNGLDGDTVLELFGEWMFGQCDARLLFIVLLRGLEKRP